MALISLGRQRSFSERVFISTKMFQRSKVTGPERGFRCGKMGQRSPVSFFTSIEESDSDEDDIWWEEVDLCNGGKADEDGSDADWDEELILMLNKYGLGSSATRRRTP